MALQRRALPIIVFVFFSHLVHFSYAQDPQRFRKEVDSIVALNHSVDKSNLVLFTGSSSIRMWNDLGTSFSNYNIVNLGFGGSEMADLLFYTDDIILQFKPAKIFIYEGDNDISFGRTTKSILDAADAILSLIQQKLPQAEVFFISPKPSVSRWHLKEKYISFNKKLHAWTKEKRNVKYVDVWTPMLDATGEVREDLFIEDNLHLNKKGYAIWTDVMKKYLK